MLTTHDLILDKARIDDWRAMYKNVWSRPEISAYTVWRVSPNEADARERIQKTIAFQEGRDMWFVRLKKSGEPIGFAGVEPDASGAWRETGVCIGPGFARRGYGAQIVLALAAYCRGRGATALVYCAHPDNVASNALAAKLGFVRVGYEARPDPRTGTSVAWRVWSLKL